jgi:uncharacterized protein YbbC (DUF1343 family)
LFGVKVVGATSIFGVHILEFHTQQMKHLLVLLLFAAFQACRSQTIPLKEAAETQTIRTGAQQTERYIEKLKNKRVGIVANQTSLIQARHLVDTLLSRGVQITCVFAPEHGFRGEAGAGATAQMLNNVDVLLFDIQDVGARFYTYISTLHYILEAAGENGKEVIVLDRPNPNGHYIDGPVREKQFVSFVGMHPIPIVHGLTVGELATMIVGENWIDKKPSLTIIPCEHYSHKDFYSIPVRPSPNLPNDRAIALYTSLCWFEGTEVSVGRGTSYPFQLIGYPGCTSGNFIFTPVDIPGVAMDPPFENKTCSGLDLRTEVSAKVGRFDQLELKWLIDLYETYPNKNEFFHSNGFFDKLAGTTQLREMIQAGKSEDEIRQSWQPSLIQYKSMRSRYLLYPDFE